MEGVAVIGVFHDAGNAGSLDRGRNVDGQGHFLAGSHGAEGGFELGLLTVK